MKSERDRHRQRGSLHDKPRKDIKGIRMGTLSEETTEQSQDLASQWQEGSQTQSDRRKDGQR